MSFQKFAGFSPIALLFIGFAAFCISAANAAPAPLKVLGFDDMSCRAWTQGDADQRALHLAWMRGLLSGHNYARPAQQVSTISNGTIEQYVIRYCREHPQAGFDEAALRLSDQFSGRNAAITK